MVADPQSQSPARAPFSDDDTNDGNRKPRHVAQIHGDRVRLAPLFSTDSRIGPRRINQADDGDAKLRRQFHLQQSLAIPFGMSTAVVALCAFFERPAFVLPDQQNFLIVEFRETRDNRPVVAERSIPVKLNKFVADQFDVIPGLRPFLMPGDQNRLPRVEVFVCFAFQLGDLNPHISNGVE